MIGNRTKLRLTGQTAVNLLERCLTLTEMAEQRLHDAQVTWFAFLDNEKPENWAKGGCPNDYAHAADFGLAAAEGERFLDWCANQRHYFLLCESGMDDYEASCAAQSERHLLRG